MKTAELNLSYFKAGDDFEACRKGRTLASALIRHCEHLKAASAKIMRLHDAMPKRGVTIHGDGHMILVSGPDKWIAEMVDAGILDETY